jgi:hypothetical protein
MRSGAFGLAQVRPSRKALHVRIVQIRAIQHDGQRVAQVGLGGEHIDLGEGAKLGHERPFCVKRLKI